MSRTHTYFSPTTPGYASWSETITSVRLGTEAGYIDEAEMGAVGISNVIIDDPDGNVGHAGDAIVGLKQFFVDEDAGGGSGGGGERLWTGYTADRRYHRGDDSLITGAARKIDVTLLDVNAFLSFRVILPTAIDSTSDFDRPAETDLERVAALLSLTSGDLGPDFLSTTLFDLGLVNPSGGAGVDMDACDYTNQRAADVLNDCAQQSGRNYFVYYDEDANELGLWYEFESAPYYDSPLRLTNLLADVDNVTTFAVAPDAVLTRDPSRLVSGVILPYSGGTVYRNETDVSLTTSYLYGWRDAVMPSSNVKSSTKAEARADRYLTDLSTEDDRITCTVKLPASAVTSLKAGQRVQARFTHLPGYETGYAWMRVLRREVRADEMTDEFYNVALDLSPQPPVPSYGEAAYFRGGYGSGWGDSGTSSFTSLWASDDNITFHEVLDHAAMTAGEYGSGSSGKTLVPIPLGEANHRYWRLKGHDFEWPSNGYFPGSGYISCRLLTPDMLTDLWGGIDYVYTGYGAGGGGVYGTKLSNANISVETEAFGLVADFIFWAPFWATGYYTVELPAL